MIKKILEKLLAVVLRVRLPLPAALKRRGAQLRATKVAQESLRRLFGGRRLVWNSQGFWAINPMPSDQDLEDYYSKSYWASRLDSQSWLRRRDVDHFLMLERFIRCLGESPRKVAMNFGSGHGGCSFLFQAAGYEVWNVDPAENELPIFRHSLTVSHVPKDLDLVYASHSLEHVTDPVAMMNDIVGHLRIGGLFFAEVPNARRSDELLFRESGPVEPPIHPPHTVYYTTDFFRGLGLKTLILDTYSYSPGPFAVGTESDDAEVIRYLGQKAT
jgi:SAM-dependent methyltransferase